MRKLFIIMLAVAAYSCGNTPKIELKFNPEEGKCYRYEQNIDMVSKQMIQGQDMQVDVKMHFTYDMRVEAKTAEAATLQFTYRDIVYVMSNPMIKMQYDSKNPAENPTEMDRMMTKIFDSFMGHPFEVKVASDGSVLAITGLDAMLNTMQESVSEDGEMTSQIGEAIAEQFNEQSLRKQFELSLKIYPAQAVKVGGKWNVDQTLSLGGGLDMATQSSYTLKDVKDQKATIEVVSTIKMKENDSGIDINLSGKQTGSTQMNTVTGLQEWSEIIQKIEGSIMGLPMAIDTKTRLAITEIE